MAMLSRFIAPPVSLRAILKASPLQGGIPFELQPGFGPYGGDPLTGQDEKPLGYPACSSNWPLRGNKGSAWEGGVRTTAFVSGGWLPESVRGTESHQLWHMTDVK